MAKNPKTPLTIEAIKHQDASRKNIPTAETQSIVDPSMQTPVRVAYERRNRDLDPQLMWRGKDEQDWSDLVVHAPPLYIQEKVHPKVLIDDLKRQTEAGAKGQAGAVADLFADFNGLPSVEAKTEFYQHDAHWANRMILGDSLQVMASLAEREGLRGKVQCIYFDPPYGIKFNSNFQWSTNSRDVKDGNTDHITREPEQVKAFRDTWRDGIHSYLTYLRDRFTVMRDLLTESGSIFVQISEENVYRVRAVMDEVFGESNFVNTIVFKKKSATFSTETVFDYLIWYCRSRDRLKVRDLYEPRASPEGESKFNTIVTPDLKFHNTSKLSSEKISQLISEGGKWARVNYPIVSQHPSEARSGNYIFRGKSKTCGANKQWRFSPEEGLVRIERAGRLFDGGGASLGGVVFWDDWNQVAKPNIWADIHGEKFPTYVVQTATTAVQRCVLMTTDPGDLVLDPTCGSGTTAFVAEQWGRRWITLDTSRVALALTRARIMGARYPYYLLADSREGQIKDAQISGTAPSSQPVQGNIRQGFIYERVPRIKLKNVADNAEIDSIWLRYQHRLEPLREALNTAAGKHWQEWEIPREVDAQLSDVAKKAHADWWQQRIARQKEIDASIAAKADSEYLYDKPYEDKRKVRVAGPFTVESLSPHRTLGVDENDELIDGIAEPEGQYGKSRDFVQIILENLKTAGVQQAHKEDKIVFTALTPWPGDFVCAEARYLDESSDEKRAAIFIGPEFGTVSRPDLITAAREAADGGFDAMIACAFNYDAHSSELAKLGRVPILKARMNADLQMADDLKNTGKGNLFVIFGEPDVRIYEGGSDLLEEEVRRRLARALQIVADIENIDAEIKTTAQKEAKDKLKVRRAELLNEHEKIDKFLPHAKSIPGGMRFVEVFGVDVFHPQTGEVRSDGAEGIACWFIDTDYNEESFFVRHAYFLGANDPYKALKTTLKAEIDADAWATLNSDTSRAFDKPTSGRIAVKVINHLGDEVMKVFKIP